MKLKHLKFFLLFISTLSAQKKLIYNNKGELSKIDYQALLNLKKYQAISAFDTVSSKPLLIYAIYIKNQKKGIIDNFGKEITPPIYDGIEGLNIGYTTVMFGFHQNYPVKIGKKYGLISNTGKSILPIEYEYIYCEKKKSIDYKKNDVVIDSVIAVRKGNEELFFSPQGKLLAKKIEKPLNISERKNYNDDDYYPRNSIEQKKEITEYGNIIKNLDNGYVIVEARAENKFYYQGLVELATNKLILPVQYNYIIPDTNNRIITIKDKKYNLYNLKGELLLKDTYEGIEGFNKIFKIKKEGKTAIFDLDLNQKTNFIYDSFSSSGPDFMIARKENKEGVIDANGNEIFPFVYDKIEAYFNRYESGFAFFKVFQNNKKGIISTKGEALTETIYDDIIPECTIEEPSFHSEPTMPIDYDFDAKSNNYFITTKDNKYGLLDKNFKPLVPNEFDLIRKSFNKDFIITGKKKNINNYYDLSLYNINTKTEILPYEYDYFKQLGNNYFMIYKNSQMGVCDTQGKLIIPMKKYNDMMDVYYFNTIYNGLNEIIGLSSYYLIDSQGTLINMVTN